MRSNFRRSDLDAVIELLKQDDLSKLTYENACLQLSKVQSYGFFLSWTLACFCNEETCLND